nr:cytokine receptor family member B15 [Misgurnus anguillicaudatus]
MSVEIRALSVLLCVILNIYPSHAGMTELAAPENVKITSINMGAILEWTYPDSFMDNVTYTARYILRKSIIYICMNSKELQCDAGDLPTTYGRYFFQVRAEHQGRFSPWTNASEFIPKDHTIIGPPTVHLAIRNNILDVHVQDPVLKVGTLTVVYFPVSYIIKYWIDGLEDSVIEKKIKKTEEDKMEDVKRSIKALSLWSRYCVQARVVHKDYTNLTPFSTPVCVLNIPVGTSCVIAAAILLPLVILASWMIYKMKSFLYPKTKLPDRFSKFEAIQHATNQKERLDKISAITEEHLHDGLSVKDKISEETSCLTPIQMEDDYKHLMQTKPAPTFYPNHIYPLCLKSKLLTHLNQPGIGSSNAIQTYYNFNDPNIDEKITNSVY